MTINITPISNESFNLNETSSTTINLLNHFDDPLTTGKVANFNLEDDSLGSGEINIVLFDQTGEGAPIAVNNFASYVDGGSYNNSIIDRSFSTSQSKYILGGAYTVENLEVKRITPNAPIEDEFSSQRSNKAGTIAMYKLTDEANSARNRWVFNVGDNPDFDTHGGGLTVFGQVLSPEDLNTLNAIASLPVTNTSLPVINPVTSSQFSTLFSRLPVNDNTIANDFNFPYPSYPFTEDNQFVRFENITIDNVLEFTFTVESNTDPDVVSASFDNQGNLILDYGSSLKTPLYRFQNQDLPGTYLFVGERERQSILSNFRNFKEEGLAFKTASQANGDTIKTGETDITIKATNLLGESARQSFKVSVTGDVPENENQDQLIRFNRFQNRDIPGTYLYAAEEESRSIRQNYTNFIEEGIAFYTYGADANLGQDIYRFQNTSQPGTYLFVGEEEKNSILANYPQFVLEGVAFEVAV
ncbi:peptidylprolyl isomerase [Cyanobacterium aponinum]|uniref:Peptidylprolyl isomerase n=1 Tax=Cyanobacterium aponinum 0216 TaxID=2676140 RepID=A0A844GUX2_9CHRO|nr:peptidylprolyl isomerase [Cyanobacterium aponinum]MTF38669.1 peptidylprolyl isomerase [Cyanobacterium aponinum 0216]